MNKNIPIVLVILVMFLPFANCSLAQSPFADQPVSVSHKISNPGQKALAETATTFWHGIKDKAIQAGRRIISAGKNLLNSQKMPGSVTDSFKIPGHETRHFVCQGICYLPEKIVRPATEQPARHNSKIALLSYYPVKEHTDMPAQIVAIDMSNGRPLRRFALYQSQQKPYTGHAGGITVAGKYLWVASGFNLYGFSVQEVMDFVNDKTALAGKEEQKMPPSFRLPEKKLIASHIFAVDSTASYVSFSGKYLWTGDFVKSSNKKYLPVSHHTQNPWQLKTWIAGYLVDENGKPTAKTTYKFPDDDTTRTGHKPDVLIFCRESVQGMAVCDSHIALSISYGAQNAKLALYRNPLKEAGQKISYKPAGQKKSFTVPAYVLADKNNWSKTISIAAGSEDLEFDGSHILVSFEGASENYRHKWSLNPLVKIEEKFYRISLKKLLAE